MIPFSEKKSIIVLLFFFLSVQVHCQENLNNVSPFLSDVFSQYPSVRDFAMSSNEDEIYFTVQNRTEEVAVIARISKIKNSWGEPTLVPFSGVYRDLEPALSSDGLKLYFVSNRPLENSVKESKDYDIWYVSRRTKASKWSEPKNLGAPINTEYNEFYPSISSNGNLYLLAIRIKNLKMIFL